MGRRNTDRPMAPEERVLWRRYRRDVQDMRIMDDVFMQSFFQGKLSMAKIAEYSGLALREVRKLNAEMKKSAAL